jgi:hypothetical protein
MEQIFMEEGLMNPMPQQTQSGFIRVFTEFLILEDLPWNMGEAPSLKRLFHFINVSFNFHLHAPS